jgi:hypothetical protein
MTTLQQILDDARLFMDDKGSKPQYTDRILLRALNSLGAEIKAINRDISLSDGFTTSIGQWEYSFPLRMWYPVRAMAYEGNSTYKLNILDPANFSDFDYRSGEITGTPRYLSVRDKKFVIYPTPDNSYEIKFEMISTWDKITEADLGDDFEDWFDGAYEKYVVTYLVFNSLKSNNDLTKAMRIDFYRVNGDWEFIRSMESMKYRPFNAMNRRTTGVVQKNINSNYDTII